MIIHCKQNLVYTNEKNIFTVKISGSIILYMSFTIKLTEPKCLLPTFMFQDLCVHTCGLKVALFNQLTLHTIILFTVLTHFLGLRED